MFRNNCRRVLRRDIERPSYRSSWGSGIVNYKWKTQHGRYYFSSCDKLFRITTLGLRFVKNLQIKAKLLKEGTVYLGDVTAEELGNAEVKWLRSP